MILTCQEVAILNEFAASVRVEVVEGQFSSTSSLGFRSASSVMSKQQFPLLIQFSHVVH